MTYETVFGNRRLATSQDSFVQWSADQNIELSWGFEGNTDYFVANITEIFSEAEVSVRLPDASKVSVGQSVLIVNIGSFDLTIIDFNNIEVALISPGQAKMMYVRNNDDPSGVWNVLLYGVTTSNLDASTLAGYGLKAISGVLNQSSPVFLTSSSVTVSDVHRSKTLVYLGGTETILLSSASSLAEDFFFYIRNAGSGELTIEPNGSDTVDGLASFDLKPSESAMIICTGNEWYTVGYGRSTEFNFTQLTKDVSAGGTITLSTTEASNKLITFTGNPASALNVVVPDIVQVYFTYNAISTANTVTLKTSAGTGVVLNQNDRVICFCDGTDVYSAQSAIATSALSLIDGSETNPALYFASQTNTGFYKYGTHGLAVTIEGSVAGYFDTDGFHVTNDIYVDTGTLFGHTYSHWLSAAVEGMVGWNMAATGGTAEEPTTITYSSGTKRVRQQLTWSSGNITVVVLSFSTTSGSSYTTLGTLTITYDGSGNVTATTWS